MDDFIVRDYMRSYGANRSFYESFPRRLDIRDFRVVLREIVGCGRVLDYGCGHGSLGYLGEQDGVTVDGLDVCLSNGLARYNSIGEVKDHYDTIIFSHALEHFGSDGKTQREDIRKVMIASLKLSDRVVVALPNTLNIFAKLRYQDDWTHNPVSPDNNDFLYFMSSLGWDLDEIVRCDIALNINLKYLFRILLNVCSACDPAYNIVYVFHRKNTKEV